MEEYYQRAARRGRGGSLAEIREKSREGFLKAQRRQSDRR